MSIEYYSGGINGNEMLIVNGSCVEMKFFCWDCSNRWLTCDIEEKWMKSKSKGWNGEKWKEDDISKVINNVILVLELISTFHYHILYNDKDNQKEFQ